MFKYLLIFSVFFLGSTALQAGTEKANELLPLSITVDGQKLQTFATLDANWRWLRNKNSMENCFTDNWVGQLCPDGKTCIQNCALEGMGNKQEIETTYGITSDGNSLKLKYVTKHQYGTNVGSRLYLVNTDKNNYFGFNLNNKEFAFDVDMSQVGCGLNSALYFVEGTGLGGIPQAGAPFGSGYGDAQCPRDIKYLVGDEANVGFKKGVCSVEMDIWEANRHSNAFTPHTCNTVGVKVCENEVDCGVGGNRYKGFCDKDGADYNAYRLGDKTLYGFGSNFQVDTSKPFTVKTQFITDDGTDKGKLVKIKRLYVQNGKTVEGGELVDESIKLHKEKFNDYNHFAELGGMQGMGEAFNRGNMILVLSLWDDESPAQMMWLDSTYPPDSSAAGAVRGPCPVGSGVPANLRQQVPNSQVIFSNLVLKKLSSVPQPTPSPVPVPTPSPVPVPTPSPVPSETCSSLYGQCGGKGWTGPTCCKTGGSCSLVNEWYSQCVPGSSQPTPAPVPVPQPTPAPVITAGKWRCEKCEYSV